MIICNICGAKLDIQKIPVELWVYVGKSEIPHAKTLCHLCRTCEVKLGQIKMKAEADFYATRIDNVRA